MAIVSRVLPSTAVFLDTAPNPTQQIIRTELVSGNVGAESFTLRASLVSPPVVPLSQLLDSLTIPDQVIVDYNDFILIYKSLAVAPYPASQNYAFAATFEILNSSTLYYSVPTAFTELD